MQKEDERLMYIGVDKRRSPRVPVDIKAKVVENGKLKGPVVVRDLSCHGALLKMRSLFQPGESVYLSMPLPAVGTVDVKARVVRSVTVCSAWGFTKHDIGVEFVKLVEDQKEKIKDTVDLLLEKLQKPAETDDA